MSPRVSDGGAGRVIAGTARGLRLAAPGDVTRPLSDRVKEALFAILEPELRDRRVLDLFAGSGAAGIEALSRGAGAATFVERDRQAIAIIRANLVRARLAGTPARIVESEVLRWLASEVSTQDGPWDVVIIDPPYDKPELLASVLEILGGQPRLVAATGIVVAKHFWRFQPPDRIGLLASDRARRFGDTALTFYRVVQPVEAPS
ncbi:MAG: 16S rRNA (guanine(966)-N(2))-methyltransferase RsmD [Candidatus Limnocylindrales bacterium]